VIRRKYDIGKRCIKMNGSKNAKLPIKNNNNNISKDQNSKVR